MIDSAIEERRGACGELPAASSWDAWPVVAGMESSLAWELLVEEDEVMLERVPLAVGRGQDVAECEDIDGGQEASDF